MTDGVVDGGGGRGGGRGGGGRGGGRQAELQAELQGATGVDLGFPSDIHQAQLLAAAIRKQQTYQPLVDCLSYYTEQGWVMHVFPSIVGIWE